MYGNYCIPIFKNGVLCPNVFIIFQNEKVSLQLKESLPQKSLEGDREAYSNGVLAPSCEGSRKQRQK